MNADKSPPLPEPIASFRLEFTSNRARELRTVVRTSPGRPQRVPCCRCSADASITVGSKERFHVCVTCAGLPEFHLRRRKVPLGTPARMSYRDVMKGGGA